MIDISSENEGPAAELSNFPMRVFVFDGVVCRSMEGLLQSFKSEDSEVQRQMCLLVGNDAKKRGRVFNEKWQSTQTLWWKGVAYEREGEEYQELLNRAYDALAKNLHWRTALMATGKQKLTHSTGCVDPKLTVLTEQEFCSRLMSIRSRLRK